ncbi:hypothetical protein [Nisaea sp.]|uniref:hypothetical protein n=1 Tax=Nisaea sp. TaxID=2024842 RepID=UPI0032991D94
MKTLETYLTDAERAGVIDHRLRMQRGPDGKIRFYIHPVDVDGETLDFEVQGNSLHEVFELAAGEVVEFDGLATKADIDALSDKVDGLMALIPAQDRRGP